MQTRLVGTKALALAGIACALGQSPASAQLAPFTAPTIIGGAEGASAPSAVGGAGGVQSTNVLSPIAPLTSTSVAGNGTNSGGGGGGAGGLAGGLGGLGGNGGASGTGEVDIASGSLIPAGGGAAGAGSAAGSTPTFSDAGGGGAGSGGLIAINPSGGSLAGYSGGNGGNGGDSAQSLGFNPSLIISGGGAGGGGGGGFGILIGISSAGFSFTLPSVSGGNGGAGGNGLFGGNGGAGGFAFFIEGVSGGSAAPVTLTVPRGSTVAGGNGGDGGMDTGGGLPIFGVGSGGNGGAGGMGIGLAGGGTLTVNGTVKGGNGGNGGFGEPGGGCCSSGGVGGLGIGLAGGGTLTVNGTVQGGAGGSTFDNYRNGGVGIQAAGFSVLIGSNASVSGGLSDDGFLRANAIVFVGATNSLTLSPGATIVGNVVAVSGGSDTLSLGGPGIGSFALSNIGASAQYQNFANFSVSGGTWTLTGTGGTTTNWTVTGGALGVDPTASSIGNVGVSSSGTLFGLGAVGGSVFNAGTVTPNGLPLLLGGAGTIGTLSVGGNYTQTLAGNLTIEVSPSSASMLRVTGTATLAGKITYVYDPGVYSAKTYTVLTASSVSGSLTTAGTAPTGFVQSTAVNSTNVQLQLAAAVVSPPNISVFSTVGTTGILGALQGNDLILGQIGGAQSGSGGFAANGTGMSAGDPVGGSGRMWLRGIGTFVSLAGASGGPGATGSTGGFLAGFDRPVADNAFLGLAAGYMFSNISSGSAGNGSVGSARVAVYAGITEGADRFGATIGYANDRFRSNRTVAGLGTATESHSGVEFSAAAQWSRLLTLPGLGGGTASVTPKLGVRTVHLSEAGYMETGVGGSDLSAPAGGTDSLQPYVGVAFAQKFVTEHAELVPEIRFGYARELFGGRNLTVTAVSGTVFPISAVAQSRDRFMVGAGLSARVGLSVSVFADYDAVLHLDGTTEQAVQAGMRWSF